MLIICIKKLIINLVQYFHVAFVILLSVKQ